PVDEEWFSERGKKTSAFETPKNAAQDDIHDDDMGVGDGFMQNAPALPKPPRFKVSTKAERRRFMEEYNLYINQTNALTANGPLKKDAFRFVRWLREFAIFHERYVGDGEQIYKPAQPKKHMNIRGAVAAKAAVAPATPVAVP
ncbi:unnamed protein product, partial [Aphanomyces euteiches]